MKKGIVPGKAIVPGVIAYAMRIRKKTAINFLDSNQVRGK
jgi:hypothetical protein